MNGFPLAKAVLADQLRAVRKTVLISIPINILLGFAAVLVAWHSGKLGTALVWFAISSVINVLRIAICRFPHAGERDRGEAPVFGVWSVSAQLRVHWMLALMSGVTWAFIPVLCDGYQSSDTLFYLTVVCGITAGAVTHGFAYALIPICFISPPLLSVIGCLVYVGGFDRYCLAATVVLYLSALIRGTWVGETQVKNESRLKHEATSLYRSLEVAGHQAREFARQMQINARSDDLTGLLNRRGFIEAVNQSSGSCAPCALLLLDLDGFKAVNDTLGHGAGDQVLIEVSRRLEQSVPPGAIVARLGGDEFAVFLLEKLEAAAKLRAGNVIDAISRRFEQIGSVHVGCSIGIYAGAQIDVSDMLLSADAALYAAKASGRNRIRFYDEQLDIAEEIRRDVERDLPGALESGAIGTWYQPIMRDFGDTLDSFEALLRWNHPKHGWISPPTIISGASATGLSEVLFKSLLSNVITAIKVFEAHGLHHARIAINVSPREMVRMAFDELMLARLKEAGLPPAKLELEITEESAINIVAIKDKLARLSSAGITIAIDDFGTGYSSLGSLQQLKAHRVKIDRAFVCGIATAEVNSVLVEAVLRISGSFGFEVVAEGVETPQDLNRLKELGCSRMQGYLFAKPMPLSEAVSWATSLRKFPAWATGQAE